MKQKHLMMNEGDEYKLSTVENSDFFKNQILKKLKEDYDLSSNEKPQAYFTGGLPGAGKSKIVESWERTNPNILLIDVDELRVLHPNFEKITEKYGSKTSGITHDDASKWGMQTRNYALENKISFILDSTLRNPVSAEFEIKKAKNEGFKTNVTMVAVNEYESLHGVYSRYLEQYKLKGEEARYVNPLLIRDFSESIIDSADVIDGLKVDRFKIVNRNKDVLYDNIFSLDTAREVMHKVSSLENFSERELATLEKSFENLSRNLSSHNTPTHIQNEIKEIRSDLKKEILKIESKSENDLWSQIERDVNEVRQKEERIEKKEENSDKIEESKEENIRRNR